jgi:hypothetical protein
MESSLLFHPYIASLGAKMRYETYPPDTNMSSSRNSDHCGQSERQYAR